MNLEQAVITHQHEDHTGNCAMLQQEFGIPVYAHPETINILKNPLQLEIYRKIMWGTPPESDARPLEKVIKTNTTRFRLSIPVATHSIMSATLNRKTGGSLPVIFTLEKA
jgi:endoribonuclease LACTB2